MNSNIQQPLSSLSDTADKGLPKEGDELRQHADAVLGNTLTELSGSWAPHKVAEILQCWQAPDLKVHKWCLHQS